MTEHTRADEDLEKLLAFAVSEQIATDEVATRSGHVANVISLTASSEEQHLDEVDEVDEVARQRTLALLLERYFDTPTQPELDAGVAPVGSPKSSVEGRDEQSDATTNQAPSKPWRSRLPWLAAVAAALPILMIWPPDVDEDQPLADASPTAEEGKQASESSQRAAALRTLDTTGSDAAAVEEALAESFASADGPEPPTEPTPSTAPPEPQKATIWLSTLPSIDGAQIRIGGSKPYAIPKGKKISAKVSPGKKLEWRIVGKSDWAFAPAIRLGPGDSIQLQITEKGPRELARRR